MRYSYEEGEIICKFDLAITVKTIPNLNDSIDDVASNLLNTTVYSYVNDKKIPIQLQINTRSISETIITGFNLYIILLQFFLNHHFFHFLKFQIKSYDFPLN